MALFQNYPNPFNPSTTIRFDLSKSCIVTLKIFDILGREVETLIDESRPAGHYQVQWEGKNFGSGVYFYQLIAENENSRFIKLGKCIYMK